MKLRLWIIVFVVLMFGVTSLPGQTSQGQLQKRVVRDSSGRMPVTQSSRLEVINQGDIFFDVNLINKTSVLYMGNSPVYTFNVRVVNQNRKNRRYRGEELVLRGNTDQRVIIDEPQGIVFLKIKQRSGGVKKLVISKISVQRYPNKMIRYHLKDNVNLAINLNHNNGQLSSTVAFKGVPIFIMATGYQELQGRRNMNILQMKGNSSGEIYYNRSSQTLYYKTPKSTGVWTKIKKIRK